MGEVLQVQQGWVEVVAVALGAGRIVNREVAGNFRVLEIVVRAKRRKKIALLRVDQLLRLNQCRLRGRDGRIGLECSLDQRVERRRLEHSPPFEGDVLAADQALRLAAMDRRRSTGAAALDSGIGSGP